MRPSRDTQADHSHTPIYDALYSEYRRSFRALPGDRSGEEHLGFTAFATGVHRSPGPTSRTGQGTHGGHTGFWQSVGNSTHHGSSNGDAGNNPPHSNGRQHTGNRFPAALPPAPRRGF